MINSDRLEFAELVKSSMMIYQQEVSTAMLTLWWNCLVAHDIKIVVGAFSRHIMDERAGRFSPKPADIIGVINALCAIIFS